MQSLHIQTIDFTFWMRFEFGTISNDDDLIVS